MGKGNEVKLNTTPESRKRAAELCARMNELTPQTVGFTKSHTDLISDVETLLGLLREARAMMAKPAVLQSDWRDLQRRIRSILEGQDQ